MNNAQSNLDHSVKTFDTVYKELKAQYSQIIHNKERGGLRRLAARYGISAGMVCQIVKNKYEPKHEAIRRALNLPAYALAPTCAHCGDVHVTTRCPKKRSSERKKSIAWRKEYDAAIAKIRSSLGYDVSNPAFNPYELIEDARAVVDRYDELKAQTSKAIKEQSERDRSISAAYNGRVTTVVTLDTVERHETITTRDGDLARVVSQATINS